MRCRPVGGWGCALFFVDECSTPRGQTPDPRYVVDIREFRGASVCNKLNKPTCIIQALDPDIWALPSIQCTILHYLTCDFHHSHDAFRRIPQATEHQDNQRHGAIEIKGRRVMSLYISIEDYNENNARVPRCHRASRQTGVAILFGSRLFINRLLLLHLA